MPILSKNMLLDRSKSISHHCLGNHYPFSNYFRVAGVPDFQPDHENMLGTSAKLPESERGGWITRVVRDLSYGGFHTHGATQVAACFLMENPSKYRGSWYGIGLNTSANLLGTYGSVWARSLPVFHFWVCWCVLFSETRPWLWSKSNFSSWSHSRIETSWERVWSVIVRISFSLSFQLNQAFSHQAKWLFESMMSRFEVFSSDLSSPLNAMLADST